MHSDLNRVGRKCGEREIKIRLKAIISQSSGHLSEEQVENNMSHENIFLIIYLHERLSSKDFIIQFL